VNRVNERRGEMRSLCSAGVNLSPPADEFYETSKAVKRSRLARFFFYFYDEEIRV
jgi:hypothetical protein